MEQNSKIADLSKELDGLRQSLFSIRREKYKKSETNTMNMEVNINNSPNTSNKNTNPFF